MKADMNYYSIFIVKGPGVGFLFQNYYYNFPFRYITLNKEQHDNFINFLKTRKLYYEITFGSYYNPPEETNLEEVLEEALEKEEITTILNNMESNTSQGKIKKTETVKRKKPIKRKQSAKSEKSKKIIRKSKKTKPELILENHEPELGNKENDF